MIYRSLISASRAVSTASLAAPLGREEWEQTLPERRRKWRHMLGIEPLPERTPLEATVTGTLDRGNYVVEKIHFQCSPGAYVPGNIYRPANVEGPLPAVLYLCGHTKGKVNDPYQANPRWFGEHGYVALVLDPIQLGECQGYHAGTIFKKWFDWYSRGYTPAGVEIWNAMRALDYLETRADVDATKMGVTGLSGGGAMSWFLAAADERIACAVPVCQTGSIEQHAADRTVDGHCDCAFWMNLHRWCTPDVGALIAPRPLLIASGTEDVIWRPFAFREDALRIKKQYAELGAGDDCDLVEDLSPHGYTPKLRKAIFEWFNLHLKGDTSPVTDDVTDVVEPEENLLVFEGNLPENDRMKTIQEWFIPMATPEPPTTPSDAMTWRDDVLSSLKGITFQDTFPEQLPRLCEVRTAGGTKSGQRGETWVFETADAIELRAHLVLNPGPRTPSPLVVCAQSPDQKRICYPSLSVAEGTDALIVDVRGTGATAMGVGMHDTARRLYMNIGQSLPERQVHDLLAATRLIQHHRTYAPVAVYGRGAMAPHAVYAALLDETIEEVIIEAPPLTHQDPNTAEFLAVLQTGDLKHNAAALVPRPITVVGALPAEWEFLTQVYQAAGCGDRLRTVDSLSAWTPCEWQ
ncbi:MAG: hypothetical protein HN742_26235 [Lentisphaerae bacterium]|jgi:dienelactone hydrolase|nr:hypothetical protein [Lentisphaerota bacterium]MBT4815601.1 hypothetical protein [Lentisphaerota bacterium]MBT5605537.1 hypothetical protein [Lentisphaerota bacterium]MBT7056814.1 hypothetical protein [Lentisphaerota bacterium]MBT7845400.1 hypothetical protein [Lentisphaerota bacterium]